MIRRAVLATAAAVALILTPSVAMAYNAPGFSSSVSDSTPTIGHPVTVTIRGGVANARQIVKLVITTPIAGPRGPHKKANVLYKRANASGVVKFTFKLNTLGTYKVEAFNKAGGLLSDQTLTVVRSAGHGNGNGDKRAASAASQISFAGLDGAGLAAGGGALLIPGAGAMLIAKRRRSAKVPA
jgi:hypothetical protein